jgi:hypothetical protein
MSNVDITVVPSSEWTRIPGQDAWRHPNGATISGYDVLRMRKEGQMPAHYQKLSTLPTLFLGGPLDGERIVVAAQVHEYQHDTYAYRRVYLHDNEYTYTAFIPAEGAFDILATLLTRYRGKAQL